MSTLPVKNWGEVLAFQIVMRGLVLRVEYLIITITSKPAKRLYVYYHGGQTTDQDDIHFDDKVDLILERLRHWAKIGDPNGKTQNGKISLADCLREIRVVTSNSDMSSEEHQLTLFYPPN